MGTDVLEGRMWAVLWSPGSPPRHFQRPSLAGWEGEVTDRKGSLAQS